MGRPSDFRDCVLLRNLVGANCHCVVSPRKLALPPVPPTLFSGLVVDLARQTMQALRLEGSPLCHQPGGWGLGLLSPSPSPAGIVGGMVYLGSVIAVAGGASVIQGWVLSRLPGVRMFCYAPIWRLPRLVSPTGLTMIAVGEVVMIVGVRSIRSRPAV